MKRRILRNAVRCLNCNEILESTTIYDFKSCSCGNVAVDGGLNYLKRSFPSGDPSKWYDDLSEWEIEEN